MATKNSDSMTTKQMIDQTTAGIAKDSGTGNQSGPTGAPHVTVPQHMRGGSGPKSDTTVATRARLAEQDRNLHGAPPQPRKP